MFENPLTEIAVIGDDTPGMGTTFMLFFIQSSKIIFPGSDTRGEKWIGHKNLSVGNLLIFYGKVKHGSEIHEFLEISNPEMIDFTFGENLVGSEGQL